MSSYHSSFTYNGINSAKDKFLLITSFEPDSGLTETFLSMDPVYEDYYDGTKRFDYGARYNTTATITITVIKKHGTDFSLAEVRSCLKWLTGSRTNSWLDMYVGDEIVYRFLGRVTDVQQQKMDARIIGLTITFTSVSPWAYSPDRVWSCPLGYSLKLNNGGVITKVIDDSMLLNITEECILYNDKTDTSKCFNIEDDGTVYAESHTFYLNDKKTAVKKIINSTSNSIYLSIIEDGVLYNNADGEPSCFKLSESGVAYFDQTRTVTLNNASDDLYTYVYCDVEYFNNSGNYLSIKNDTTGEETIITNMSENEKILLDSKQFIVSDVPHKVFGDTFNFVWPRLAPGVNDFTIDSAAKGTLKFTYRYPMKVGDCAMDIDVYGGELGCVDNDYVPTIKWENIIGTPTTIGGYGITDAYDSKEIDNKLENIDVEWNNISNTPNTIEGYGIADAYTVDEVDDKIDNIEVSGGGSVNIDEGELNDMLSDILG